MIHPLDALTLAHTKLRTNKIRTGLAVGISGILFGLLVAAVIIFQGVLGSVDRFGKEGLGQRYILDVYATGDAVGSDGIGLDDIYWLTEDPKVISEIEQWHKNRVATKALEANRLNIHYEPEVEDPSPIYSDSDTKHKSVDYDVALQHSATAKRIHETAQSNTLEGIDKIVKPFNPLGYLEPERMLNPDLRVMRDGKEQSPEDDNMVNAYTRDPFGSTGDYQLSVSDGSIIGSFVSAEFDPSKGELPVIIPYSQAEKLLGLSKLPNTASANDRLERLYVVKDRVSEIAVSFCYRNDSSRQLLAEATAQRSEIDKNKNNQEYQQPSLIYELPDEDSCGAVAVASDVRTTTERAYDESREAFDRQFNGYQPPEQHKVVARGVGITGDFESMYNSGSAASLAAGLLSSQVSLYWSIPDDLLSAVSDEHKPAVIFENHETDLWGRSSRLVEFSNVDDAKRFHDKYGCNMSGCGSDGYSATTFGSSSLVTQELQGYFRKVVLYVGIAAAAIAAIILAGTIGRTIADGRKESAVFRAIGARRGDIFSIYTIYTLLLALRIVLFTFVLGVVVALIADYLMWQGATVGAQLAFGALDRSLEFRFFDVRSGYLLVIVGVIIVSSLLAMLLPLLRATRRNPITDMRDE